MKKDTQEVVGHLRAKDIVGDACHIFYMIGPEYQDKGLGIKLVAKGLNHFKYHGIKTVCARVDRRNGKSVKVLEKNGFSLHSENKNYFNFVFSQNYLKEG